MYFINEYNKFKNICETDRDAEIKKLEISATAINKLIDSIGTTAYEYMTDKDKTFCKECFDLIGDINLLF